MTVSRPRRSRARRGVPDHGRSTRPGPREQRVLLLLAWAGFLTTEQVRLAGGYPTLRRAQRRLRTLLDHGLIRAELQGGVLHRPSIHLPTAAARERLMADGELQPGYRVPRLPRAQKLGHALLVRDVFAAFAAADLGRGCRLEDFRFDSDLSDEEPFHSAGLVPDAIASVRLASGGVKTFAVEADTGCETSPTLRRKLARWRAVLDVLRPQPVTLLAVATRETRRRTLAELMLEARINEDGVAVLVTDVASVLLPWGTPHDYAVQPGRSERRSALAQPLRVVVVSRGRPGPFWTLR
jgi:hypothetical protein